MLTGVFCACIFSQLCSAVYHIFHSVAPHALFNLDLVGVCCMSFGSPWLYVNAHGTQGLGIYMLVLFSGFYKAAYLPSEATDKKSKVE